MRGLLPAFLLAPLAPTIVNLLIALIAIPDALARGKVFDTVALALLASAFVGLITYPATAVSGWILVRAAARNLEGPSVLFGGGFGALFGCLIGFAVAIPSRQLEALLLLGLMGAAYGGVTGAAFVKLLPKRTALQDRLARIAARELATRATAR